MNVEQLSVAIESALVARNPRSMQRVRAALAPGYCLRAARLLSNPGRVLIATGFPVAGSFETDGPLGAIALYRALEALGGECTLACADPLAAAMENDFRTLRLLGFDHETAQAEATRELAAREPERIVCIERPGLAANGRYHNMRKQDISERCAIFDYYVTAATCPSIGIGDGGNEIGMGAVAEAVAALDIIGAQTRCDELLPADVSNWGAYGLIAMLDALHGTELLAAIDHRGLLEYLSAHGSVDGVTGENTLTEDGLPLVAGEELLATLGELVDEARRTGRDTTA